jgi:hypothetical protein
MKCKFWNRGLSAVRGERICGSWKRLHREVTFESFLEGQVTVQPGGEEKPFQEEGTLCADTKA